jgi:CheY-like chemotaxis protein
MANTPIMLVADDSKNDLLLLQKASKRAGNPVRLYFVRDGEEAMDYLRGTGKFADGTEFPMPDVVLLDINMPRRTGLEVLGWLRSTTHLKRLRALVMSGSTLQVDINRAYDLGANAYLIKPIDFDAFIEMFTLLTIFFTKYVAKPDIPELTSE